MQSLLFRPHSWFLFIKKHFFHANLAIDKVEEMKEVNSAAKRVLKSGFIKCFFDFFLSNIQFRNESRLMLGGCGGIKKFRNFSISN